MGQFDFTNSSTENKSATGAQVDAAGRSLLKVGLSLSIMALWQIQPIEAQEREMADSKKGGPVPSVLTYDDDRSVSPALEHYTKGPLLDGVWTRPERDPHVR